MQEPKRLVAWFLLGIVLLGVVAPSSAVAEEGGITTQVPKPPSPPQVVNLLAPVGRFLSGSTWLMVQGMDPRLWRERPDWDVLAKKAQEELSGPLAPPASPSAQGAGPLVPFRDPAPAFSRDLLVTRDFSAVPFQTEPTIAVDPKDPDHLVLSTIDYNFPTISTYTSVDGGATWEGPVQVPYLRQDLAAGGDPVIRFDRQGNLYVNSISIGIEEYNIGPFAAFAEVSSIAVSRSDKGGTVWAEPISSARSRLTSNARLDSDGLYRGTVGISFLDKPWMSIGPQPNNPDKDAIYVTYTDFRLNYAIFYIGEIPVLGETDLETTIGLVHSEDGGQTWSTPVAVSPTVRRTFGESSAPGGFSVAAGRKRIVQGSQPAVAPDGTVYVAWLDSTDDDSMEGLAEVYVARSNDGGKTFSPPALVSAMREPGFRPRTAFFRYWGSAFPQLSVGPQGEVYVVYAALPPDKPTDDGDVYLARSLDGGATWDRPRRLNQDEGSALQFFPTMAVDPKGNVHAAWGDMRDDPAQTRYHIYYTRSQDQGQTWGFEAPQLGIRTPDTRVTDFPSNPNRGFPRGQFLGDYFSMAATETDVYVVWADTRLGEFGGPNQKIGFARQRAIASPQVFLSPPGGAGGQQVTLQGFNLQPDMNVFVQVGGVTVTTARTNPDGRFTANLFMPVTGQGANSVTIFDESGNVATGSFFTDFGFGDIQKLQQDVTQELRSLRQGLGQPGRPGASSGQGSSPGSGGDSSGSEGDRIALSWWLLAVALVGAAVTGVIGGTALTLMLRRRPRPAGDR